MTHRHGAKNIKSKGPLVPSEPLARAHPGKAVVVSPDGRSNTDAGLLATE